jgi:hypothetical protein
MPTAGVMAKVGSGLEQGFDINFSSQSANPFSSEGAARQASARREKGGLFSDLIN